jgi:predicted aspartyl protease
MIVKSILKIMKRDTGARETVISPKVVEELNLQPSGRKAIYSTAEGKEIETDRYTCTIRLKGTSYTFDYALILKAHPDFNVLIGMDIITQLKMCIDKNNVEITSD